MTDALKAAEKNLEKEMNKWLRINFCAMALALHREWGFGAKRLNEISDEIKNAWEECAEYGKDKSMMQMLDEETGIEIRHHETNKSWRELAYFNNQIPMDPDKMTRAQWIYMRQQQAKWARPQTLAIVLLALHRKQGFATERLVRLSDKMSELIDIEYKRDAKAITEAAKDEVNFTPQIEVIV